MTPIATDRELWLYLLVGWGFFAALTGYVILRTALTRGHQPETHEHEPCDGCCYSSPHTWDGDLVCVDNNPVCLACGLLENRCTHGTPLCGDHALEVCPDCRIDAAETDWDADAYYGRGD